MYLFFYLTLILAKTPLESRTLVTRSLNSWSSSSSSVAVRDIAEKGLLAPGQAPFKVSLPTLFPDSVLSWPA